MFPSINIWNLLRLGLSSNFFSQALKSSFDLSMVFFHSDSISVGISNGLFDHPNAFLVAAISSAPRGAP